MIFTLDLLTEDAILLAVLAVCAIIAIVYHIYKTKTANRANENLAKHSDTSDTTEIAPNDTSSADEEIVAVITAAVAMAEAESDGLKFRVVSFRRI